MLADHVGELFYAHGYDRSHRIWELRDALQHLDRTLVAYGSWPEAALFDLLRCGLAPEYLASAVQHITPSDAGVVVELILRDGGIDTKRPSLVGSGGYTGPITARLTPDQFVATARVISSDDWAWTHVQGLVQFLHAHLLSDELSAALLSLAPWPHREPLVQEGRFCNRWHLLASLFYNWLVLDDDVVSSGATLVSYCMAVVDRLEGYLRTPDAYEEAFLTLYRFLVVGQYASIELLASYWVSCATLQRLAVCDDDFAWFLSFGSVVDRYGALDVATKEMVCALLRTTTLPHQEAFDVALLLQGVL